MCCQFSHLYKKCRDQYQQHEANSWHRHHDTTSYWFDVKITIDMVL
jgi:hypothetical protein